jgi:peptidoglycan hydrolase-like protein with peptidoglycan-binding domain
MARTRTRALLAGTTGLVLVAAGGVALWRTRAAPTPAGPAAPPPVSTPITRVTLVQTTTVSGRLGYGEPVPLSSQAVGTVTWLPTIGDVLTRGKAVLRADEHPVVLLYGSLPMFRPLALSTKGADVAQFERNLAELGYSGFTVDEEFTASTVAAVKRWQRMLGVDQTGVVDANRVIYADGPIRVAQRGVRVGASATGEVLQYTGVVKVVTVNVNAGDSSWAVVGTKVTVALPGDQSVAGEITAVGTEASAPTGAAAGGSGGSAGGGADNATVPVTVSIADQQALGTLEKSPVDVEYTARKRENVLTVPVAALLALAEGGYGLEILSPGPRRILSVQTGLVANGRVEVSGDGLTEGMSVGLAG